MIVGRLLVAAVIITGYFAFDYLYCRSIAPGNLYLGFICRPSTWQLHLMSMLFAVVPVSFLPVRQARPSDWAIVFLYTFAYLPTTFMIRHRPGDTNAFHLLLLLLVALVLVHLARRFEIGAVRKALSLSQRLLSRQTRVVRILLLLLFACLMPIYLWASNFRIDLAIATIYERRLDARELSIPFLGYIVSLGRSLVPVYAIYFFTTERDVRHLILLALTSLGIFSLDGTKTALLIPGFLFFVTFLSSRRLSFSILYFSLCLLILVAIAEVKWIGSDTLSEVFVRRIFAVPGFLNAVYWDFFSHNPKIFLTDSIGRLFAAPVYPTTAAFMIGVTYFGREATNANTGMWMGGYAHFGIPGILMVSILAGLLLRLVDKLTQGHLLLLGSLTCAYFGIIWSEQMFHTSFLSGGVFYLLIVLIFLTRIRLSPAVSYQQTISR